MQLSKIDFSVDTNPLGVSTKAKAAIRKAIKQIHAYPYKVSEKLIRHLAKYHNVDEENFLCGCGTTEFVYLIPRIIKTKKALTLSPANPEYARAIALANGAVDTFVLEESENFVVNTEQLIANMPGCDLVFISNPNNPTGQCMPLEDMRQIVQFASKHEIFLIIDESFMEFCKPGESIIPNVTTYKTTVVLRSFSKFYALSGLRLGFIVASRTLIEKFRCLQTPFTVNSISQDAAIASLRDKKYAWDTKNLILQEKDYLDKELKRLGCKVFPTETNFFLVRGLGRQYLAQHGVHFPASSSYGLSGTLTKLSFRRHRDNVHLVKLLKSKQLLNHKNLSASVSLCLCAYPLIKWLL